MNPNRLIGLVVMVIGIALLIVGINSSHSVADRLSDTFRGRFTDSTNWYIFGGIALALVGAGLTFVGFRGKGK